MAETTAPAQDSVLRELLSTRRSEILQQWRAEQSRSTVVRGSIVSDAELREQSANVLDAIATAVKGGSLTDIRGPEWASVRDILSSLSASRARQGFTVSETAQFLLSLKLPVLAVVARDSSVDTLRHEYSVCTVLLDQLSLFTVEAFTVAREGVINRQQQEMLELSTPVVELFDGILALPLIGTLDSARTQVVMETLLQQIVDSGASIAILDITGVPTVDTLVAQHLLKTVAAARLMGADCIISGIRPQIAQTIVHLGVELQNVDYKSNTGRCFADRDAEAGTGSSVKTGRPTAQEQ